MTAKGTRNVDFVDTSYDNKSAFEMQKRAVYAPKQDRDPAHRT
jgi:hypothetical protein